MPKTILTVDDSPSIRQMVRFTLSDAGYAVIEAGNGQEALDQLDKPVSLILTDLNMPVMDGIELTRRVRELSGHRFTPVVLLTTESQDEKKQQGKAAGATGWIVKPFKAEQLLAVVGKLAK